jgi:hypothetical protein
MLREEGMGWMTGFEPATSGSTIRRSNQLSYTHHMRERLGTRILAKGDSSPQPMTPRNVTRER